MAQTKRRLNRIRLDKIAAVDLPCQEHATVAIVKRAPGDPVLAIAKRSFDEALRAQLVGERISEVFWRAFDKQYAVREAFREALADELAAGGDGSEATEGFTAAMRTLAESAATAARDAGNTADTDLESAVEQAVEKWLKQQETVMSKITTKAALTAAVSSFSLAKSTMAEGLAIVDAAVELDAIDLLPADSELAKQAEEKKKKGQPGDDKAVKALQREVAVLKMAEPIRKHFDALDTAAQDAFLAKSAADQAAEVEAANATDPVVYKSAGGVEIRKSDGAVAALLAKQLDGVTAELVVLKGKSTEDSIEKRAAGYPNVAKGIATDMLKSAAQLGEDTDAGKAMLKSLDAMNKAGGGLMKSLGSNEAPAGGGAGIEKARTDFNSAVSAIMARDSLGMGDAMAKARNEHPALFAEAYPETAEQDA